MVSVPVFGPVSVNQRSVEQCAVLSPEYEIANKGESECRRRFVYSRRHPTDLIRANLGWLLVHNHEKDGFCGTVWNEKMHQQEFQ